MSKSQTKIYQILRKIADFSHFLVVFLFLLLLYPYEICDSLFVDLTSAKTIIFESIIVLTLLLAFLFHRNQSNIPRYLYFVIFVQFLGLVFGNSAKGEPIPFGQMILKFAALSMVVHISSTIGLISFFRKYNRWILLMAVMATISLILVWLGLIDSLYPFEDLSDDEMMYNYGITFSQHIDTSNFRPAGYFDEPGTLASWGLFAILFNRAFVKDKKTEWLLMIALVGTLSFGYFMQLFVFILLFMITGMPPKKIVRNSIYVALAIGIVIIVLFSFKDTDYDGLYQTTLGRIDNILKESDNNKKGSYLAVDDRTYYTKMAIREFESNPLWGTEKKNVEVGNNVYEPLALYGIFGTSFFYFPFIFLFFKACIDKDSVMIKCMIVMLLGFLHRPFHNNLLSHFIIYSFIVMYYQHRMQNKQLCTKIKAQ